MVKGRNWNEDKLRSAVLTSLSIRNVLKLLGLAEAGGNYQTIQNAIEKLNLDISHFRGQSWRKGLPSPAPKRSLQEILVKKKHENTYRLKNRLLKEGVKERLCEKCNLREWFQQPTPLELHHIDGDRKNNQLENLSLLCPNCHALTGNYRGKNRKV